MNTFAITVNDGPKLDCETYGIAIQTRSEKNQAEGQVTLAVARRPNEPFLFNVDDIVTIYRNGVQWWRGVSGPATAMMSADDFWHAHTVKDPWTVLENCQWRFSSGDSLPTSLPTSNSAWKLLADWASSHLSTYLTFPYWPNSVTQQIYPIWPNKTGPVAQNVTNLLKPIPLASVHWDHSTTPPTMVVWNQGDSVLNLDYKTHNIGDAIQFTRRDDLAPSVVELSIIDTAANEAAWGEMAPIVPIAATAYSVYPPTATVGGYGSVLSINTTITNAQIKGGIAQYLHSLLSVKVWEGSFTVATLESGLLIQPGMTVNISGNPVYSSDWAAMNAVVQSVTTNVMTGVSTVTVGASGYATMQDLMTRVRWMLQMKFWDHLYPSLPFQNVTIAEPGAGAGTDANVTATGEYTTGVGGIVSVTEQMGPSGFAGTNFVDVYLPAALSPNGFSAVLANSNATAITLNATVTVISTTQFRIMKNVNSPIANSICQWAVFLTPL